MWKAMDGVSQRSKQHQLYRNLHVGMDHVLNYMGEKPLPASLQLRVDDVAVQDIWTLLVEATNKRKQMLRKAKMKQKKKLEVNTAVSDSEVAENGPSPLSSSSPVVASEADDNNLTQPPARKASPAPTPTGQQTALKVLDLGLSPPPRKPSPTSSKTAPVAAAAAAPAPRRSVSPDEMEQLTLFQQLKELPHLQSLSPGSKKFNALAKWVKCDKGKNSPLAKELKSWLEQKALSNNDNEDSEDSEAVAPSTPAPATSTPGKKSNGTAKKEKERDNGEELPRRHLRTRRRAYEAGSDSGSDEAEFLISGVDVLPSDAPRPTRNKRRHSLPATISFPTNPPSNVSTSTSEVSTDSGSSTTSTTTPMVLNFSSQNDGPVVAASTTVPAVAGAMVDDPMIGSSESNAIVLDDSDVDEEEEARVEVPPASAPPPPSQPQDIDPPQRKQARTKTSTKKTAGKISTRRHSLPARTKVASPPPPPKRKRQQPSPSPPSSSSEEDEDEDDEEKAPEEGALTSAVREAVSEEQALAAQESTDEDQDLFDLEEEDVYALLERKVVKNTTTNRDEVIYLIKWTNQPQAIWEAKINLPDKSVLWLEKVSRAAADALTPLPNRKRARR
ncbi:TPA: hypothetical protein N0F65_009565 [Lagenidium giganteum]|uniref:Chromo domain-containing protein n=1 Tax=Lagenidium giganteum TaxID=4803 RepID=A0AAV2YPM4_9STRA|nr:TPA: hypothetical protein N0F65_009565 [Lagenidium giganteum]